jgi:hypothetical protein
MTHSNRTRELIRMGGFFAGFVVMLIYDPPRLEGHPSYLLANIVGAVCGGIHGALASGFAFPLLMFPWPESFDFFLIVVMIGMCIFTAFAFWFVAEVFVAANPRQLALTRLLRKKAS